MFSPTDAFSPISLPAELLTLHRNPTNSHNPLDKNWYCASNVLPNSQPLSSDVTYVFPADMSIPNSPYVFFDPALSGTNSCASLLTPASASIDTSFPVPGTPGQSPISHRQTCSLTQDAPLIFLQDIASSVSQMESLELDPPAPREVPLFSYYNLDNYALEANSCREERSIGQKMEEPPIPTTSESTSSITSPCVEPTPASPAYVSATSCAPSVESLVKDDDAEDLNPDPNSIYTLSRRNGLIRNKCKICLLEGIHRRGNMMRHVQSQVHSTQSFSCSVCNVRLTRKDGLKPRYQTKSHKNLAMKKKGRCNRRKRVTRKHY